MATFGGFGAKTTATAAPALFGFGTPATASSGGFSFGAPASSAATTQASGVGFGFGTPQPASTGVPQPASTGGLTFATPGTATAQPTVGFNLGTPAGTTTQTATGFTGGATPLLGATATTAPSGLGLLPKPATTAAATTGSSFGFAKPLSLGATTAATTTGTGLGFGTSATTSTGLGFGGGLKLGLGFGGGLKLGTATTATTAAGFGALGTATSGASIFDKAVTKTIATGLGGVDTKTTTSLPGTTTDGAKTSDGKTAKDADIHSIIIPDIEIFKKFVKEEKGEAEHIKRMSSTPMVKVQEDTAALKQLLSVLSSGLQRNACVVEKLKREMTQELKNAEMAIRTKDIPPGLQYENTAPTQYFQLRVEDFESQMLSYRQQIEMLENHLVSLHQPNRLTSEELILTLRKLNEAFIAIAAQVQQIHEAVKTQKEQYLNYLRVFRGDNRNIFERQKKTTVRVPHPRHIDHYGQSPFPGMTDAAAVAMAAALTRSQQPQTHTGTGPPVTGFSNFGQPTGFSTSLPQPAAFGNFGTATTTASGFKVSADPDFGDIDGFGTGGTGIFGGTSNLATTQSGLSFGTATPAVGTAQPQLNLSAATEQPFQLNKPPVGAKRGKR